mmetsp:Transcript_32709/g.62509  ORF Transcript_32709/g.62509 Transcript_32709/m.62509 type:complete len:120 (+) Transcript_32709:1249-1608(+)
MSFLTVVIVVGLGDGVGGSAIIIGGRQCIHHSASPLEIRSSVYGGDEVLVLLWEKKTEYVLPRFAGCDGTCDAVAHDNILWVHIYILHMIDIDVMGLFAVPSNISLAVVESLALGWQGP